MHEITFKPKVILGATNCYFSITLAFKNMSAMSARFCYFGQDEHKKIGEKIIKSFKKHQYELQFREDFFEYEYMESIKPLK